MQHFLLPKGNSMIPFPDLSKVIQELGEHGRSLASLLESPTSTALVGILAPRVSFHVRELHEYQGFDLFVCEDTPSARLPMPSPFAIVCLGAEAMDNPDSTFPRLLDLLLQKKLHARSVLLFHPRSLGPWETHLRFSTTHFVTFSSAELVEILLARPPRTLLMDRVVAQTPLSLLNPYTFHGPVGEGRGKGFFVGRTHEIEKLCRLDHSYALVGPRTIGKTSLMYRAYDELRSRRELAIRVEFSPALSELDLTEQIVRALINEHNAPPALQGRISPPRLQRFLSAFARNFPSQRAAIMVDEADKVHEQCPRLTTALRILHNLDRARLVFAGFKGLRKAVNDAKHSLLMNVFHDLPLSGLSLQECGALIFQPMKALGIDLTHPEKTVEAIYQETGGAPSRIQLVCSALVNSLDGRPTRRVTLADAETAVRLPEVQSVLRTWFRESTSPLEKQLTTLAALHLPCNERELVAKVLNHVPIWTEREITVEIEDLKLADVLALRPGGDLVFSCPTLRDLVPRVKDTKAALSEVVHETRRLIRQNRGENA